MQLRDEGAFTFMTDGPGNLNAVVERQLAALPAEAGLRRVLLAWLRRTRRAAHSQRADALCRISRLRRGVMERWTRRRGDLRRSAIES